MDRQAGICCSKRCICSKQINACCYDKLFSLHGMESMVPTNVDLWSAQYTQVMHSNNADHSKTFAQ